MARLIPSAVALAFAATAASFIVPTPSRADANARVCARIYDLGGYYEECNYYNYAQCKASVSGRSGECFDNRDFRNSQNQVPARGRYRR